MGRLLTLLLLTICSANAAPKIWYWDTSVIGTSANNGASWANAFTNVTFSYVSNQFSAGDTNYFSGGTTSNIYYGQFNVTGGTISTPTYYMVGQEAGKNGLVVFDNRGTNSRCWWFGGGGDDYIVLSGAVNGATNMIFKDSTAPTTTMGIDGSGNYGIVVSNIACHDIGSGFRFTGGSNVVINNCSFERIRNGFAVSVSGADFDHFDMVTVHHCSIFNYTADASGNGPDGFKNGYGVTIYNCTFQDSITGTTTGGEHPDAIQGVGVNWKIYNNTFHSWANACLEINPNGLGSPISNFHDLYIFNNEFRNDNTNFTAPRLMEVGENSLMTTMSNIFFLNNTCVDWPVCFGLGWDNNYTSSFSNSPVCTNIYVLNNIFYNCGSPSYWALGFGNHTNANFNYSNQVDCSANVITAGSGGSTQIVVAARSNTDPDRFYVQQTSRPRYGYTPAFTSYVQNSTNGIYTLLSSDTAANGWGTNLSAIFTTDKAGTARPSSGAWTIGAYQIGAGGSGGATLNVSGTARVGTMTVP